MCGRLITKYSDCGCTRAETTCRCEYANEYIGAACLRFYNLIVRIAGRCPRHLDEYHEMGGDDYDYMAWESDKMDIDLG
jgi:hypothetical protein